MRRDIINAAIEAAERLEAIRSDIEILAAAVNRETVDARSTTLCAELQSFLDETAGAIIDMAVADEL